MSERKEKFTPGPWRVHLDKRNGTVCSIIEDKSGDCVANTFPRYPRGERNANGHLIAAAPEMYAIVSTLEKWHIADDAKEEDVEMLLRKAAKVAKKARGEE